MVKLVAALHEVPKNADQIPAHCAADAPIVHLKQFLLCIDHQLMVDPDLTKLIFDHRNSQAMVFTQNSVQQRSFSGSKEASQDSDRYARHRISKQEKPKR
jgi:hypothetical protein